MKISKEIKNKIYKKFETCLKKMDIILILVSATLFFLFGVFRLKMWDMPIFAQVVVGIVTILTFSISDIPYIFLNETLLKCRLIYGVVISILFCITCSFFGVFVASWWLILLPLLPPFLLLIFSDKSKWIEELVNEKVTKYNKRIDERKQRIKEKHTNIIIFYKCSVWFQNLPDRVKKWFWINFGWFFVLIYTTILTGIWSLCLLAISFQSMGTVILIPALILLIGDKLKRGVCRFSESIEKVRHILFSPLMTIDECTPKEIWIYRWNVTGIVYGFFFLSFLPSFLVEAIVHVSSPLYGASLSALILGLYLYFSHWLVLKKNKRKAVDIQFRDIMPKTS